MTFLREIVRFQEAEEAVWYSLRHAFAAVDPMVKHNWLNLSFGDTTLCEGRYEKLIERIIDELRYENDITAERVYENLYASVMLFYDKATADRSEVSLREITVHLVGGR